MRILDRYIGKSIVSTFVGTVLVFAFLYVLIDATSNLSEIIDRKVSFSILFQYYAAFLPIILVQTSTFACLISVLFTFSHLNGNNEVVVLRSSGMSFWRIAKPALFFGLLVSAMMFWLNEHYVPQASVSSQKIRDENIILASDGKKKKEPIKDLTFYGLRNRLYYIESFDPNTYDLKGISIIGNDGNQNMREKITALSGKWTNGAWQFSQCHISSFHPENLAVPESLQFYPEKVMDIKETPQDFLRQRLDVASMNIRDLNDYIHRFSGSGAAKALTAMRVNLHQKIAFPFRTMVIILVGLPFAMMARRRKAVTFTSFGIAVAIGFLYYVLDAVGLALGTGGWVPPFLSAWIAPGIFFIAALYLIRANFN